MNTGQVTGRNPTSPPSQIIAFRKVPLIAASIFLVAAIAFLPVAGAQVRGGPKRVSVDSAGNQADHNSFGAAISGTGRFIAFHSRADNLVPPDTNDSFEVYVHDLKTGTTERVSVDSFGNQGDSQSAGPTISNSGRYVGFTSFSTNLVLGDTNDENDVFIHDRKTRITERVSVDSAGRQANAASFGLVLSRNARFAAFNSLATNLGPGDTDESSDMFVRDRKTGKTERITVTSDGTPGNALLLAISPDGRLVGFISTAPNLVSGDTNGAHDVFVHDRWTGAIERVSVDSAGNQGNGHSSGLNVLISRNNRYVFFYSEASNLVPGDTNGVEDVFVHDRKTRTTRRLSVDSAGNEANGLSSLSSITPDGRFVAFTSDASNLVPGDTNNASDVFVHDRKTGRTERLSTDSAGTQGNDASFGPSISHNGRIVAFASSASNLVPGDTNGRMDVFVVIRERKKERAEDDD